jgi:hypothetical protein
VREREIAARRRRLDRVVDQTLRAAACPSLAELFALSFRGWSALSLTDAEKVQLSAAVRIRAREHGAAMALLSSKPGQRDEEERAVISTHRLRRFEDQQAAEQLVGALWDLVPFGADRSTRAALVRQLWPATSYQRAHWDQLVALADELAATTARAGPLRAERLPRWATNALSASADENNEADEAEVLALTLLQARVPELEGLTPFVFTNPRIARFVAVFGAKGLRRLAGSSRPAVALAVCTSFLPLDHDSAESQWQSFRELMDRVEELVECLEAAGDLDDENRAGGPLSAEASDLEGVVLSFEALEAFALRHHAAWDHEVARIGPFDNDQAMEAASRAWQRCFAGVPMLCELVNGHLRRYDYGCSVDGELRRPPRRPRLGSRFVSDDQIDEATTVELFCFGCEVLRDQPDALRVWLALWVGALRPRESHVERGDLVPYGSGFLVTVPRRWGKTGWREAMFPSSAMAALGLRADHLFPDATRGLDPTSFAEAVCQSIRDAWATRRRADDSLPEVPGRTAYFPREVMADVIRRHQRVPWVLTKAFGHESEASDEAYTELTSEEAASMYAEVWDGLSRLMARERGACR